MGGSLRRVLERYLPGCSQLLGNSIAVLLAILPLIVESIYSRYLLVYIKHYFPLGSHILWLPSSLAICSFQMEIYNMCLSYGNGS